MLLNEFLIALGVKADTDKVKKFNASLAQVGSVATIAVTGLAAVAAGATKFFDGAIRNAESLAKTKGLLFDVTKDEIEQSKRYIAETDRLKKSYDSIKTRIAFGLLPTMQNGIKSMNEFLASHKDLIANGIKKVVDWLFKAIQVIVNTGRFINKIVEDTVGWKNALMLLAIALSIVKRSLLIAFATNPVTWIMAAIVALMLLVDDFMTYLDGGKSQFGEFWGEMAKWIEENKEQLEEIGEVFSRIFKFITDVVKGSIGDMIEMFGNLVLFVFNVIKMIYGIFTGDVMMMQEAWAGMVSSAIGVFSNLWEIVKQILGSLVEAFTGSFVDIGQAISDTFDKIVNVAQSTISKIKSVFVGIKDAIIAPFKAAFNWVSDKFGGMIDFISNALSKLGVKTAAAASTASQSMPFPAPRGGGQFPQSSTNNSTTNTSHITINTNNPQVATEVATGVPGAKGAKRNQGSGVKL